MGCSGGSGGGSGMGVCVFICKRWSVWGGGGVGWGVGRGGRATRCRAAPTRIRKGAALLRQPRPPLLPTPHPPLFPTPPRTAHHTTTHHTHTVALHRTAAPYPQRIMEIRSQIAKEWAEDLRQVSEENSLLMRETLASSFSLSNLATATAEPPPQVRGVWWWWWWCVCVGGGGGGGRSVVPAPALARSLPRGGWCWGLTPSRNRHHPSQRDPPLPLP